MGRCGARGFPCHGHLEVILTNEYPEAGWLRNGPYSWLFFLLVLFFFCIFAYCGLVGNPHLTAIMFLFAPLSMLIK